MDIKDKPLDSSIFIDGKGVKFVVTTLDIFIITTPKSLVDDYIFPDLRTAYNKLKSLRERIGNGCAFDDNPDIFAAIGFLNEEEPLILLETTNGNQEVKPMYLEIIRKSTVKKNLDWFC